LQEETDTVCLLIKKPITKQNVSPIKQKINHIASSPDTEAVRSKREAIMVDIRKSVVSK
jgi:hypothetical protein